jgi:hypothetical protein
MVSSRTIGTGILGAGLFVVAGALQSYFGFLGSRGESTVHEFQFQGLPAEVVREDNIWALDDHKYRIDGSDIEVSKGRLTADNGSQIKIDNFGGYITRGYSVTRD